MPEMQFMVVRYVYGSLDTAFTIKPLWCCATLKEAEKQLRDAYRWYTEEEMKDFHILQFLK